MSKKISIVVICLIIAISLAISIYVPNRQKMEEIEDTSINYSIIEQDGKFGIVEGEKTIIEPQYDEIIIPNQHRAVFVCQKQDEQKIVDNKNKEIFKEYDNVQLIQIVDNSYEKNILTYQKDEKYGLLSLGGNIIIEAKYDEVYSTGYKEGELFVKQDGKFGIIDKNGDYKIKNKYDEIQLDEYYTEDDEYKKSGYIVKVTTDEGYRYGYYDNEGVQVLKEEYNQITRLTQIKSNDIYLIAVKNGQCGVFINNSKIIDTEYQSIDYNTDKEIFIVEKTGKFGVFNINGTKILETEYNELTINGMYIYCVKNEEQKVFDITGNEVNIPFDSVITETSHPKYFIRNDAGNYSITNSNFEKLTTQNYKFIEYAYDTYFIATNEQDKVGLIDIDENILIEFNYDLIQIIKGKNIIQAIDFSTNKTDIFDYQFDLALEMTNANIEILEEGIKVYNNEQENILDNNGKYKSE